MKFRHSNRVKRVSRGCRNHGSCKWCLGNREHQWRKLIGIASMGGSAMEGERNLYAQEEPCSKEST